MATDRYSDVLTHPCLRVSAAQVQMTEEKSEDQQHLTVICEVIGPNRSAEQTNERSEMSCESTE